jgi:hypothetical protein
MDRIDADALVIPRLQPPYASTLHRDAEAVEHESLRWLRSVGIGVSRREAALLAPGGAAPLLDERPRLDSQGAARRRAAQPHPRALVDFAALDERLRGTDPALVGYSDGLRAWIAALPAWSYASDRYAASRADVVRVVAAAA